MGSCPLNFIGQDFHKLTRVVEYSQMYSGGFVELISDGGGPIEGIGIILIQIKMVEDPVLFRNVCHDVVFDFGGPDT